MAQVLTQSQLSELSVEDRLRLIELIWASLTPDDLPMPEWHKQILEQRLKRMEEHPHPGIPWEEAREMLRKRREANANSKA